MAIYQQLYQVPIGATSLSLTFSSRYWERIDYCLYRKDVEYNNCHHSYKRLQSINRQDSTQLHPDFGHRDSMLGQSPGTCSFIAGHGSHACDGDNAGREHCRRIKRRRPPESKTMAMVHQQLYQELIRQVRRHFIIMNFQLHIIGRELIIRESIIIHNCQ